MCTLVPRSEFWGAATAIFKNFPLLGRKSKQWCGKARKTVVLSCYVKLEITSPTYSINALKTYNSYTNHLWPIWFLVLRSFTLSIPDFGPAWANEKWRCYWCVVNGFLWFKGGGLIWAEVLQSSYLHPRDVRKNTKISHWRLEPIFFEKTSKTHGAEPVIFAVWKTARLRIFLSCEDE